MDRSIADLILNRLANENHRKLKCSEHIENSPKTVSNVDQKINSLFNSPAEDSFSKKPKIRKPIEAFATQYQLTNMNYKAEDYLLYQGSQYEGHEPVKINKGKNCATMKNTTLKKSKTFLAHPQTLEPRTLQQSASSSTKKDEAWDDLEGQSSPLLFTREKPQHMKLRYQKQSNQLLSKQQQNESRNVGLSNNYKKLEDLFENDFLDYSSGKRTATIMHLSPPLKKESAKLLEFPAHYNELSWSRSKDCFNAHYQNQ